MVDGGEQLRGFAANEALKQGVAPFGDAIQALKAGLRVARAGWNGKGMWLSLVTTWSGNVGPAPEQYALLPFICMRTVQADFVPWLASQTDMLADDWMVVPAA
ncbi:DUF2829 domain-containing protein [Methylobacterium sp. WL30]|uniref:DUF2829 domain-containing protein n=1 Tax=unclassified Methylobacterium TaxID=2615210 RepID=UPI0011C925FB|nr:MULTISPECIES: DUF2829 domain-containing protein [unclassified Methylobacterium]TXN38964.1 DUF2829 domain-containing protein [Methylobacterium sp. WL93]TXN52251.1 DUF2829 domain-containing protein [Methylobacterium sp. WL119]TXN70666.1 DUF2829 domain-containing protein [Methylobacterium sp. WL30]